MIQIYGKLKSFAAWLADFRNLARIVKKMSEQLDRLTKDVNTLTALAQSTADSLVVATKDIADLKAQLAAGNVDPAALSALADKIEATISTVQAELPAPTPAPTETPAA